MKIRCVAVDDEPLALEKLKNFIKKLPQLELLASFNNSKAAFEFISKNPVHLLFLDIQMGAMSGIDIVEQMPDRPQVIFTTAFNEYAIKAFELSVTDYLLKPYTFERFRQAVNKASDYIQWQAIDSSNFRQSVDYIFVKSGYKLVKIVLDEILYIEGMRDFQHIITTQSKVLISHSFQELEKMLPSDFIRCQKSYIVSKSKIENIEKDRIKIGEKLIPIGEAFKENFYNRL